jgi:CPA2 family monovalent cation:H+ antiporter-2
MLVLLMNDALAAQRCIDSARRVAPEVPVLMRTRYLAERARLARLGARDVVAEEVEGAIEVIARLLRWIDTPRNLIDDSIRRVRDATHTSERRRAVPRKSLGDVPALDELKIESVLVRPGCAAIGASPASLRLRSETGALVVGVRRGQKLLEQPDPTIPFDAGDIVYFVGTAEALRRAAALFGREGEGHGAG